MSSPEPTKRSVPVLRSATRQAAMSRRGRGQEADAAALGKIRIGISGWRYKGWRGVFYPGKLPQRRELEYASRKFDTIELNGSFYSLQRPRNFCQWDAE